MISTSEDEAYEDVGYEEPPRKKRKRSPKLDPEQQLEDKIKEEPSKDPAIVFLCRVLKQFLIRDNHRLYYKRLTDALKNEYNVSTKAASHPKRIFNAIDKANYAKLQYLKKSGAEKSDSRCFSLLDSKSKSRKGIEYIQQFRANLKYSAWQYRTKHEIKQEKKLEKETKWRWVNDGKYDKDEEYTEYAAVTNGIDTYHQNDIIEVKHIRGPTPRPWIARIVQLYEDNEGKKMNLRWFWFYNQIVDECKKNKEKQRLARNARNAMRNDNLLPTAADIFESMEDDDQQTSFEEGLHVIKNKVNVVSAEDRNYRRMVNGRDVFVCDYFIDIDNKTFMKKEKKDRRIDYKLLQDKLQSMENNDSDHNENIEQEEDEEEDIDIAHEDEDEDEESENDDDLSLSDIEKINEGNSEKPPDFKTKPKKKKEIEDINVRDNNDNDKFPPSVDEEDNSNLDETDSSVADDASLSSSGV